MRIKVNKHTIEINKEELINEKEVNVSKCYFEFSEDYTDSMVKKALFTKEDKTYEMLIDNNECNYPSEILENDGVCILGVYAYTTDEEFIRFNPTPQKFAIEVGSLRPSENSQPITPSQMEQYQQALQEGLIEVDETLLELTSVGDYAKEQGDYAKSVGEQLEKDKDDGLFKGETGPQGPPGKDGTMTFEELTEEQRESLKGEPGKDGVTPVKGVDYFTEEEKKEIVNQALQSTKEYMDSVVGNINNELENIVNGGE